MAKIKTTYLCSVQQETEMKMHLNADGLIFMQIDDGSGYVPSWICLDRATAIKFCKDLKREISYMESEVNNG